MQYQALDALTERIMSPAIDTPPSAGTPERFMEHVEHRPEVRIAIFESAL